MNPSCIVAVVVLYKQRPAEAKTILSLAAAFSIDSSLLDSMRILLWDNSPVSTQTINLPFQFDYVFAGQNLGTSGAYNYAKEYANSHRIPWMLLLDQDTAVTVDFLSRTLGYSTRLFGERKIGAVAPFVFSHGSLVSPRFRGQLGQMPQIPPTFNGLCEQKAYAINSGTLMRVAALEQIGGYSNQFWLDFSDIYVFEELYRSGKYLYVASDLSIEHEITNIDFDRDMATERYCNFLAAEGAFVDLYSSAVGRAAYLFRLFLRTLKQYRRFKRKVFSRMTWSSLYCRLANTRQDRMHIWRNQLSERDIPAAKEGEAT